MSWHCEVVGTKEECTAVIEENAASSSAMPPDVASYIRGAIESARLAPGCVFHVKTNGHRPLEHASGNESIEIRVVRNKPWKTST